ncbi:MAG: hypothetical protein L3J30_01555 [Marinosulfonomonas sp.]|nr:hypothetical protein [Marinosulfonomonas sp.]
MDNDLFLVFGLIIFGLSIPSIIGALVDGRVPRGAAIMVMIGSGMIAVAIMGKPSGYSFDDVPKAFTRVIGKYLN